MTRISLNESTSVGYDIEPDGRIFVKTYTILTDDDGNEVSRTIHRRPIEPDADVSKAPAEVKALATLVRTPERLARFAAAKPAPEPVTRTR